jgi:MarR family transcriptional regulator, transcriptional regulator for hemolysin
VPWNSKITAWGSIRYAIVRVGPNYHAVMTAMAPDRAEPDLSFLFDRGGHLLRTRMAAALAEIGLTARMHCVLVHALEAERTQIQLAEIGDMDKTTMVVTVDALERAGLAERRPSGTDRRARVIAVTPAGARVARRSQEIVDRVHREALAALPERDRTALVRAMKRLVTGGLAEPAGHPDRPTGSTARPARASANQPAARPPAARRARQATK